MERYLRLEKLKYGNAEIAGHIVVGTSAPEVCPVCSHPKAYFEIKQKIINKKK